MDNAKITIAFLETSCTLFNLIDLYNLNDSLRQFNIAKNISNILKKDIACSKSKPIYFNFQQMYYF